MSGLRQLLRRPGTPLALVFLCTIVLCWILNHFMPTFPQIQDEFSYLLASDTYSSFRLTNPSHVLWRFFETIHVLEEPTYQSKYPPGQGMALAVGQILFGSALVGVWLSFAAACTAVAWMLKAWLPTRWAVLGGLAAAFNVGNLRFWGGTFMGGSVAMLGGALLFGALIRAMRDPRPRYGLLIGTGLLLLALSRPYEGLVAALPAALVFLVWLVRQREFPPRRVWRGVVAPLTLILALGGAWVLYYNYRVTGDPIRLPYQVYLERYGNDAFFDPDAKPVNRQRAENVRDQIILRSDRQFIHHIGGERYYALLILVALRWLLKSRWGRFALGTFLLTIVATAFTRGAVPHYSAPVAGLGIGLVVQSLAIISSWIRWRVVATAFVAACLALYFHNNYSHFLRELSYWEYKRDASYVAKPPPVPIPDVHDLSKIEDRQLWERFSRWAILARPHHKRRLEEDGDRHLVVVKYAENSTRHREWVYNRADIDGSKIVWARWLDNRPLWPLLSHYPDRRVWLIEPELDPWTMRDFPAAERRTWYLREHGEAHSVLLPNANATDPVHLEVVDPGEQQWFLQAERAFPPLQKGKMYIGGFRARAEAERPLGLGVTQSLEPWANLGLRRRLRVGREWRRFAFGFRAEEDYEVPRLLINFGGSGASVEIADVWLQPLDERSEGDES